MVASILSSAGGGVEVINVRAASEEDTFEVGTVSGDIQLDRVSNPKVTAKTVNGTVTMTGPSGKVRLVRIYQHDWRHRFGHAARCVVSVECKSFGKARHSFRFQVEVSERRDSSTAASRNQAEGSRS